jgi:hypothetical protein
MSLTDRTRPGMAETPAPKLRPWEPRPDVRLNACELAYAAREAVRAVLPAAWQKLPDGTDTANVLAGTIANHYAEQPTTPDTEEN